MANSPRPDKAVLAVRVPKALRAAAVERARQCDESVTAVVEHALREYLAGRFTPPPPRSP